VIDILQFYRQYIRDLYEQYSYLSFDEAYSWFVMSHPDFSDVTSPAFRDAFFNYYSKICSPNKRVNHPDGNIETSTKLINKDFERWDKERDGAIQFTEMLQNIAKVKKVRVILDAASGKYGLEAMAVANNFAASKVITQDDALCIPQSFWGKPQNLKLSKKHITPSRGDLKCARPDVVVFHAPCPSLEDFVDACVVDDLPFIGVECTQCANKEKWQANLLRIGKKHESLKVVKPHTSDGVYRLAISNMKLPEQSFEAKSGTLGHGVG